MSKRPTFTLYLATAKDGSGCWEPRGFFVFLVTDGDAKIYGKGETHPGLPLRASELDLSYAGFQASLPHLPNGCHVRVVSAEDHLYGSPKYPGIFNTTPAERAARSYMRRNPKDGLLANHGQLREIDVELSEREITTSAERSATGKDEALHQPVRERARRLLRADPSAAPAEWWV